MWSLRRDLLCLLCVGVFAVSARTLSADSDGTLLDLECTRGPSYWCDDIKNAKSCGAVKHCIQALWEHEVLPPDDDSVCQICKDMVKQARDQLKSSETQEVRAVFEGSCKLIPIKTVSNECMKLYDEFNPEVVETLASQTNPQVVCSVAGLCNSPRIDKILLEEQGQYDTSNASVEDCGDCNRIAKEMRRKFHSVSRDDMLQNMIEECGTTGSFSDSCAALVITHFNRLYNYLQQTLESDRLCQLSDMCHYKSHSLKKERVQVIHESTVGMVNPNTEDDVPCEFCEQLVVHLKDILVANTTEQEFETMLKGICKHMTDFKKQCLTIVDEYYAVAYDFLVNSLKPKEICTVMGICPRSRQSKAPVWPLVPHHTAQLYEANRALADDKEIIPHSHLIGQDEAKSFDVLHQVDIGKDGIDVHAKQPDEMPPPLPLERMMPQTLVYVANKEGCALCEYVLHYLQMAITAPATEKEIEDIVDHVCDHLPDTITAQCKEFVNTYGNAVIALLAEEIEPSVVCPKLGLCPSEQIMLDLGHTVNDKPTCPLCLLAVERLVAKLEDNKTEEEIRKALDSLCSDLPKSVQGECRTFIENYSEQLIEALIADFTPKEVCTYLTLCDASSHPKEVEILTNEISQEPVSKSVLKGSGSCVLCEFVLSKIDAALKDHATEEEIKNVVHNVCKYIPKTVAQECNQFVDQYADLVITLLAQSLDPKEVCTAMSLCPSNAKAEITASLEECAVCDAVLTGLDKLLADPAIEDDTAHALQKVCSFLPARDVKKCKSMVKVYGPSILNLIARHTDTNLICENIGLCLRNRQVPHLLGGNKCTWGPDYWCQSEVNAKACGTMAHCQENVWLADTPSV